MFVCSNDSIYKTDTYGTHVPCPTNCYRKLFRYKVFLNITIAAAMYAGRVQMLLQYCGKLL